MTGNNDDKSVEVAPPTVLQKTLKSSAYPASAAVGAVVGHRYVRNALYDSLKKDGAFAAENEELHTQAKKIIDAAVPVLKEGEKLDLRKKFRPLHVTFADNVSSNLKKMGFNNTLDYFMELPNSQRWEAAGIALSAASVGLGVALTISDNKTIMEKLGRHDTKNNAQR